MAEGRVIIGGRLPGRRLPARRASRLAGRGRRHPRPHRRPDHRRAGPLGAIEVFRREPPRVRRRSTRRSSAAWPTRPRSPSPTPGSSRSSNARRRRVARRAETERSLRDITARIAALREPDVVLERVVEEAKRLLGTDGAHLTRMADDGTYLVPGRGRRRRATTKTRAWLLGMRFPLGGGINGLAAEQGGRSRRSTTSRTRGSRTSPTTGGRRAAGPARHGGGAAARARAARSSARSRSRRRRRATSRPRSWTSSRGSPTRPPSRSPTAPCSPACRSEERYRYLVENAPDLVWSIGADARLTFLSDAVERLTGIAPGRAPRPALRRARPRIVTRGRRARLGGRHGGRVAGAPRPGQPAAVRTASPIPAEFIAVGPARRGGRFAGRQRLGPRHARARPPRARAARVGDALPPARPDDARTSSTAATPRAGSCSWPRAPRRCSAGRGRGRRA